MNLSLTLEKKAFILIAVPLFFQIVFTGATFTLIGQVDEQFRKEARVRDTLEQTSRVFILLFDKLAFDVLDRERQSDALLTRRKKDRASILKEIKKLKSLVSDDPEQVEVCDSLLGALKLPLKVLEDKKQRKFVFLKIMEVRMLCDDLVDKIFERQQESKRYLQEELAEKKKALHLLVFIGITFNTFLAISLALMFNRSTSSRLNCLVENTTRLATGQELLPALVGEDELSRMDAVFRKMVSALKKAEARERAIVENALDVICSISADGKITEINPAPEQLWGLTPEELRGSHVVNILEADSLNGFLDKLEEIKKSSDKSATTFECRVKRKDGSTAPTSWAVRWSDNDEVFYCVAHDFSEREKVDQLRRELVAMVSHDLKAPLTSIQLSLNLLEAGACGELPEQAQSRIATADRNTKRLLAMISDLLDLEKMEAGMLPVSKSSCNLEDLARKAVDSVQEQAASRGIAIKLRELDHELEVDPERIAQVLINFLSNAIKFSPDDETITVEASDAEKGLKVSVKDNGPGIDEEGRKKVFDRFSQVGDEAAKSQGTGLGLAISRAIIEAHGGTIGVDSEAGKGSTFWFVI